MKTLALVAVLAIMFSMYNSKVKLMFKASAMNKLLLRGSSSDGQQIQSAKETVYITLLEASREIYSTCQSICDDKKQPTFYAEIADFPGYGNIFRCQCGDRFTHWYNLYDLSELDYNVLRGDALFNNYLDILGYDTSDCNCDNLKSLLGKLIGN